MISHGIRGLVAQDMSGAKAKPRGVVYKVSEVIVGGAGSLTIPETGWIDVFAWAGGASGEYKGAGGGQGGGGGGGIRRHMRVTAGQRLDYSIGAGGAGQTSAETNGLPGSDTTVTFPDGIIAAALGGIAPTGGGYRLNGDVTGSTGGNGGVGANNGSTGGDSGGTGGALSGSTGGGGGAAGFGSYIAGLSYGAGSPAISGTAAGSGAGSGASTGATQAGGAGRLLVYFIRE